MENYKKWTVISGIILSIGLLTILVGGLTDVYGWGNPAPILISGVVIFVAGGIIHQIKS